MKIPSAYAWPVAVSLTLAAGGLAMTNIEKIAVLETEVNATSKAMENTERKLDEIALTVARIEVEIKVLNSN